MTYIRTFFSSCGGVLIALALAELAGWQRGPSLWSAAGTDWPTTVAVAVGLTVGWMVGE